MRIEVGYGLEGTLTDVTSRRIIAEDVAPLFREGKFAAGIDAGVDRIIKVVAEGKPLPPPPAGEAARRRGGGFDFGTLLLILFIVVPVVGGILRSMFGKLLGSTVGGGLIGAAAWFFVGSLRGRDHRGDRRVRRDDLLRRRRRLPGRGGGLSPTGGWRRRRRLLRRGGGAAFPAAAAASAAAARRAAGDATARGEHHDALATTLPLLAPSRDRSPVGAARVSRSRAAADRGGDRRGRARHRGQVRFVVEPALPLARVLAACRRASARSRCSA